MLPVINAALRLVMVETITACAAIIGDEGHGTAAGKLHDLADLVACTRYHMLYTDLKDSPTTDPLE